MNGGERARPGDQAIGGLPPPDRREALFLLFTGIFIGSLVIANVLVFKVWSFFGIRLIAGIIPYPVTFLVTDLVSEIYGRKRASLVVWSGFVASLWVLAVILLAGAAPTVGIAGRAAEEVDVLYVSVFGMSVRAIFASMVAYLVAQLVDVHVFHFWRNLTAGRHLWLRNNGSTVFSQLVDTVLVVGILFGGKLETGDLLALMGGSYLFKAAVALFDTPFFYLGVRLCRRAGIEPAPVGE
ncbi:MAG: queuosine precursor transporter [Candidatus Eisenbacteria bacterium]